METKRKIFTILIIYCFFLFFLVLFLNSVISFDESLFSLINNPTNSYLFSFFNLITYLGSSIFWILLIIIFWLKNQRKLSLQLLFAFILDTVALSILKVVFLRPRPSQAINIIDLDIGPSFPSGHSERAFSGAVVLANHYKKYNWLFYILSILVSFSRVYIGLHYPLDVLIGAINGIILGMIALSMPTKIIKETKSTRV
jgi:undecaprenyl-diphosphatase